MIPAARYVIEDGVNVTIQEAAKVIVEAFKRLSVGLRIDDLPSQGGLEAAWNLSANICFCVYGLHVYYGALISSSNLG